MTGVLLSLGSNLEPRIERITKAIEELSGAFEQLTVSHMYETEPVGYTDQPAFINACVYGTTSLDASDLSHKCREIEKQIGRIKREQWHEREIDIDIVLFGECVLDSPELQIPHPRFRERAFVLVPAAEIAPNALDPVTGTTMKALLAACTDASAVALVD